MITQNVLQNLETISPMYRTADPYPHIIIDNFIEPDVLEIVLRELKNFDVWWSMDPGLPQHQVNKYFTPSTNSKEETEKSIEILKQKAPITHAVLSYLYSPDMLSLLSQITGIQNLVSDDSWFGAGAHKVVNGGKLSIHADFNLNWITNKYRRINLLLYLNKDWKEEYNGYLELWEKDMSACAGKIAPIFNRAVIFNTDKTSYHGHPIPLKIPSDIARYSLALYYYTDDPPPNDEEQRFVTWKSTPL